MLKLKRKKGFFFRQESPSPFFFEVQYKSKQKIICYRCRNSDSSNGLAVFRSSVCLWSIIGLGTMGDWVRIGICDGICFRWQSDLWSDFTNWIRRRTRNGSRDGLSFWFYRLQLPFISIVNKLFSSCKPCLCKKWNLFASWLTKSFYVIKGEKSKQWRTINL